MISVAIFGFGVVGSGTAEVLYENQKLIAERVGEEIDVKYILDLRDFPESRFSGKIVHDINIILNDPDVRICAELMGGSHPAFEFSSAALKAGKSVVTSNKEVVANFGPELLALAAENKVHYLFEASVGGGIPLLHPISACLTANELSSVCGILNGTTNYILGQMTNAGKTFAEALAEAQEKGYAERDPSADIEGLDACRKTAILGALAYGKLVPTDKIPTVGITKLTLEDCLSARKLGGEIKLIGRAAKNGDGSLSLSVGPTFVPDADPLAHVNDVFNGVKISGNAVGDVMFYGRGAGKLPTASAVVSDIIEIASGRAIKRSPWLRAEEKDLAKENGANRFFVRLDKNIPVPDELCEKSLSDAIGTAFLSSPVTKEKLDAFFAEAGVSASCLPIL